MTNNRTYTYEDIIEYIKPFHDSNRTESASFLIWYLINYYNLDEVEAIDSVCDSRGDRGIDGIYVNENLGTIDVFQAKLFQTQNKSVGDKLLRELHGSLNQIITKTGIEEVLKSTPKSELSRLLTRLKIVDKLDTFKFRGIFVANVGFDRNAESFVKSVEQTYELIGKDTLSELHVSSNRDELISGNATFSISGHSIATYSLDTSIKAIITTISANDLIKLEGIKDQSLFSLNVRASLGNTKINRDIETSIKDKDTHRNFPLFHNGITIVCENLENDDDEITVSNYFVVNGCQSLNNLYKNSKHITEDLRILTKIIQVGANNKLTEQITSHSNNQNGVKPRDFKSNTPIQVRLQNDFKNKFGNKIAFETKRGELFPNAVKIISNEEAGLNIMAFDLEEPWGTHRTYRVFDDKFNDIFARPDVTAYKILFLDIIMDVIKSKIGDIENKLVSKYGITRFMLLYFLKKILASEEFGQVMINNPEKFIKEELMLNKLKLFVSYLLNTIIIEFNAIINESDNSDSRDQLIEFPYREKLRDRDYVKKVSTEIITQRKKDINRKKEKTLEEYFNSL